MSTTGCFVSERIGQPRVGYIDPKTLEIAFSDDGGGDADVLEPVENISRALIETVVGGMTCFELEIPKEEAFPIPSFGFRIPSKGTKARRLMDGIRALDDKSIINAVKLSGFVVDRGEPVERINPDEVTIQNVRMMIERSVNFVQNFDQGTPDSLYTFTTAGARPTKEGVYQCLRYWSMRLCLARSGWSQNIRYLDLYNPRLNEVYRTMADAIPDDMIAEAEKYLISHPKESTRCSVTRRIKQIKQPRGGYINPRTLEVVSLGDGIDALNLEENVSPGLIGIAVDYLTRFMLGESVDIAFEISMFGAQFIGEGINAWDLMEDIEGLDDRSITNAVKLAGFDVCVRSSIMGYRPVEGINPDESMIQNVRTMVERSLRFFDEYGPVVFGGFTFEGGYTDTVSSGDGDFMTADTLWDFKVSKARPTKNHTLQLLMYWRMGLRSIHAEFQNVKYLGIYNPRLNEVYRISVDDIPRDVITEVDRDVIGYPVHRL